MKGDGMVGGYGRGRRHRRLYNATGTPGIGRGPCRLDYPGPQTRSAPQEGSPGRRWYPSPSESPGLSWEDELRMLEEDEQMLRQELEDITKTIEELKKDKKKEVR
jgi:hypothetical protein